MEHTDNKNEALFCFPTFGMSFSYKNWVEIPLQRIPSSLCLSCISQPCLPLSIFIICLYSKSIISLITTTTKVYLSNSDHPALTSLCVSPDFRFISMRFLISDCIAICLYLISSCLTSSCLKRHSTRRISPSSE